MNTDHTTDSLYKFIHLKQQWPINFISDMHYLKLSIAGAGDRWINEYGALMEWQWHRKTAVTAEKPVPVHNSALHKPTCTSLG